MTHKLYIMRTNGFIKVGVTSDTIEKRLSSVQVGTPTPIHTITTFNINTRQEAFTIEKAIHKKLERRNTFGEWFKNVRENSKEMREVLSEFGINLSDGKVINVQSCIWEDDEMSQISNSIDRAVKNEDMQVLIGVGLKISQNKTVKSVKNIERKYKEKFRNC